METPKFEVGQRVICTSTEKEFCEYGEGIVSENIYLHQFKAFAVKVWFFGFESVRCVPEVYLVAA